MNIVVGKTYLTRDHQKVTILMQTGIFDSGHKTFRPYLGDNGQRYNHQGNIEDFNFRQHLGDLVAEYTAEIATDDLIVTVVRGIGNALKKRFIKA